MSAPDITVLPIGSDNYSYLVTCGDEALAIDPADAGAIAGAAQRLGVRIAGIALTHHHGDHTAGCAELIDEFGCDVAGPDDPRIRNVTRPTCGGDAFGIAGLEVRALATPGHTQTHLSYLIPARQAVFTGDALFVCGCGRVSNARYDPMWQSLLALRALPGETQVYCGHNYTVDNMAFAQHLEPGNTQLTAALQSARDADATGTPTVPSTIADEIRLNPFLRCDAPGFQQATGLTGRSPMDVFEIIRRRKDAW